MSTTARPAGARMRTGVWLMGAISLLPVACQGEGGGDAYSPRRPAATPTAPDSRLIGLVGTLSGTQAWRGEDAFEGADVAIQELNRRRPEDRPRYELVSFDDGGDEELSVELVEQAAAQERMAGVVYAGPPEGLPNAEDALAEAGIPAILVYGDLYGARALSPHVFQASPSYRWEARRIASYLVDDRGYRRVGGLVEGTPDGSTAGEALEEGLALAGGRSPVLEIYSPGADSVGDQLDSLEDARVEAIVVHGAPAGLAGILAALEDRRSTYSTTDAARTVTATPRLRRPKGRPWRPQVVGLDLAIAPRESRIPPGTVASDTYARGAHYLPIPSLKRFRRAFVEWWDAAPSGWEQRSYDAVSAIGRADAATDEGEDIVRKLESFKEVRFGGLDVTLGPDDHTLVGATTVGLWVSPAPRARVRERGKLLDSLPWVPLSRGFSIDGERTDVLDRDWKYLFRKAPVRGAPAPRIGRMKFGVNTPKRDPVH